MPFDEALAMTVDGRITDAVTVVGDPARRADPPLRGQSAEALDATGGDDAQVPHVSGQDRWLRRQPACGDEGIDIVPRVGASVPWSGPARRRRVDTSPGHGVPELDDPSDRLDPQLPSVAAPSRRTSAADVAADRVITRLMHRCERSTLSLLRAMSSGCAVDDELASIRARPMGPMPSRDPDRHPFDGRFRRVGKSEPGRYVWASDRRRGRRSAPASSRPTCA